MTKKDNLDDEQVLEEFRKLLATAAKDAARLGVKPTVTLEYAERVAALRSQEHGEIDSPYYCQ